MIKTSIIALLAVAAMGSVAAPAFAESNGHDRSDYSVGSELDTSNLLSRLHDQGINATAVEPWGALVRATIVQPDGSQVSQLFTRDNLKPAVL
jgi:hypothetical protein